MRDRRTIAVAASLAASSLAASAAAQDVPPDGVTTPSPGVVAADGRDDPARYPPSSVRWKLVAGGVGVTAAAYGVGAACAAAWPEVPGAEALYVPVAGPWITLGQSGCSPDDPGCEAIVVARAILLVLDGLVQAGGLAVAGEGLFMTTESEAARAPAAPADRRAAAVTVAPVPLVARGQAGVGLAGAF